MACFPLTLSCQAPVAVPCSCPRYRARLGTPSSVHRNRLVPQAPDLGGYLSAGRSRPQHVQLSGPQSCPFVPTRARTGLPGEAAEEQGR